MTDKVQPPAVECASCDYFVPMEKPEGSPKDIGQCRANPPGVFGVAVPVETLRGRGLGIQVQTAFPTVECDAWCGAHPMLDFGVDAETEPPATPS